MEEQFVAAIRITNMWKLRQDAMLQSLNRIEMKILMGISGDLAGARQSGSTGRSSAS